MKILILAIVSLFYFISGDIFAQTSEHLKESHPHKHTQYAKLKNPIPMTEESIKKGATLYEKHCIGCHGKGGAARGILDLTKGVLIHGESDGEIFHLITNGVKGTQMKGFKKELTDEGRWQLVNYIKSLKSSPATFGKQIRETNLKGYTLTYRLLDLSERAEMMKTMEGHSVVGMTTSGDITNHLMVFIQKPDGKLAHGDVAFVLTGPDGRDFRTITMGMYGGYGADVTMKLKGVYTIRTKIILGGTDVVKLNDEFTFQMK